MPSFGLDLAVLASSAAHALAVCPAGSAPALPQLEGAGAYGLEGPLSVA